MNIDTQQVAKITEAPTVQDAMNVSGQLVGNLPGTTLDTHGVRAAYVRAIFGSRAMGGFFVATRGNVNAKFREAWEAAQA